MLHLATEGVQGKWVNEREQTRYMKRGWCGNSACYVIGAYLGSWLGAGRCPGSVLWTFLPLPLSRTVQCHFRGVAEHDMRAAVSNERERTKRAVR
jgi:hypothetical protein